MRRSVKRARPSSQVSARFQGLLHGFRHLQLAAAKFVIGVRLAEQSIRSKELVQRGESTASSGFGM